jgi:RNA polymerase sigma-70 factor (ECF subfamily)
MSEDPSFRELLGRVRAGEEDAAAELVSRYEPVLRRTVRVRLRDSRLRRQFDSEDVCQSVLASFFLRAAAGQYELNNPEDLLHLLSSMVRNKVANLANRAQAGRRDYRRVEGGDAQEREVAGHDATPSRIVAADELLQEARRRLAPEERRLLECRQQGREWADIAAELGGSPEALRKRLDRAIERVATELELAEGTGPIV